MPTEILMPALSPTMEEGTLAKWLVKEGDTVASGDILAEIETDKATMEFEAVDEGVLGRILIAEGAEGVKVNTPIAVLLEEGELAAHLVEPGAVVFLAAIVFPRGSGVRLFDRLDDNLGIDPFLTADRFDCVIQLAAHESRTPVPS